VTSQTAEKDVCGARLGGDLGQSRHKTMRTIEHFFRRTDITQLRTKKTHALDRRRHSEESKLKKIIKIRKTTKKYSRVLAGPLKAWPARPKIMTILVVVVVVWFRKPFKK
jgi:hypothetical protein